MEKDEVKALLEHELTWWHRSAFILEWSGLAIAMIFLAVAFALVVM